MCTLTIVPQAEGRCRLGFNRDEQRDRPAALPPRRRRFGPRTAILPLDPVSGGTWIAVNDRGLALALLNANPLTSGPLQQRDIRLSRGTLIPQLLRSSTLAEALERVDRLAHTRYEPFRLVLVRHSEVASARWDGKRWGASWPIPVSQPVLFTSSGLGDALVEGPRCQLFEETFAPDGDWVRAQDLFHRHSWPDRSHLSVCMRRADACTVSHTVIDVGPADAALLYYAEAPDRDVAPVAVHLSLVPEGCR
jgi:hypothetical protein